MVSKAPQQKRAAGDSFNVTDLQQERCLAATAERTARLLAQMGHGSREARATTSTLKAEPQRPVMPGVDVDKPSSAGITGNGDDPAAADTEATPRRRTRARQTATEVQPTPRPR